VIVGSRWSFTSLLTAAALALLAVTMQVNAQPPQPEKAAAAVVAGDGGVPEEAEETVARDSPRASMMDFLSLCRAGDFETAAAYLELSSAQKPNGATLARRLKAVLDRKAWVELEQLSPESGGNTQDGLPALTDELGRIEGPEGVPEPVRIVRRRRDTGVRWVFSSATVSRIENWYARLDDRWMIEHLPQPLLRTGPRELMWWQWLALPMMLALSWGVALALSHVTARILGKITARSATTWDDMMVERLKRPLTLWWTIAVAYALLPWLALYEPAEEFVLKLMNAAFLFGFFWGLSRIVDIGAQVIFRAPWAAGREASRSLISLGARVAKVAVIAIAAVALLSQLGYPIASILAGLGVGGLAVALAAQKTVENLFGAFSIGADAPFREGDFVRVDDFVGTVEQIGLRSTRFRTLDRTLISIPNGKLADMKLETFAVRDRLRFFSIIGLVRSTTSEQLRAVMQSFNELLKAQPKIVPESASVRLEKFGPSSLDIEVVGYFDTRDWGEFTLIRQELLLSFMGAVERAGTELALPASTVRVVPPGSQPGQPPPPPAQGAPPSQGA